MRRAACPVGAVSWTFAGLAACTDPSIALVIDVPEEYRPHVQEVNLQVLAPRAESKFTCNDVSFGRVLPEALRGAIESERTVELGNLVSAGPVPRIGRKVFWVVGRAESGLPIAAGCAELASVENLSADQDLAIELVPTRIPIIEGEDQLPPEFVLGRSPIRVRASDTFETPLAHFEVAYELAGADGKLYAGTATSASDGVASIQPPFPSRAGPAALELFMRWSAVEPFRISGFLLPEIERSEVPLDVTAAIHGRLGPVGEPMLVAAGIDGSSGTPRAAFHQCYVTPGKRPAMDCQPGAELPDAGDVSATLLERPYEERDMVALLAGPNLFAIQPGAPPVPIAIDQPSPPQAIFPSGDCTRGDEVLVSYADAMPQRYGLDGRPRATPEIHGRVLSAPCVGIYDGGELRTVVAFDMSAWLTLNVDSGTPQPLVLYWPVLAWDVEATPRFGNTPRTLIGLQPVMLSIALTRATFELYGRNPYLVPYDDIDMLPQFPEMTRGGDIDGDGELDLVSVMYGFEAPGEQPERMIWARLSARLRDESIAGASVLPFRLSCPGAETILGVRDFDGDGVDEILIVERGCTPSQVYLLRMTR